MGQANTTTGRLIHLGEQLRVQRLRMNLTLEEVTQSAAMSLNAVRLW